MILPFSSDHLPANCSPFSEEDHLILLVDMVVKDTEFHSRETLLQGLSL